MYMRKTGSCSYQSCGIICWTTFRELK